MWVVFVSPFPLISQISFVVLIIIMFVFRRRRSTYSTSHKIVGCCVISFFNLQKTTFIREYLPARDVYDDDDDDDDRNVIKKKKQKKWCS